MKMEQVKHGMRVYWGGDNFSDPDYGTVLLDYETLYPLFGNHVWVKWGSTGEVLQINVDVIIPIPAPVSKG